MPPHATYCCSPQSYIHVARIPIITDYVYYSRASQHVGGVHGYSLTQAATQPVAREWIIVLQLKPFLFDYNMHHVTCDSIMLVGEMSIMLVGERSIMLVGERSIMLVGERSIMLVGKMRLHLII